jgi:hypothetical protein
MRAARAARVARVARSVLTCGIFLLGACGSDEGSDDGGQQFPVQLQSGSDIDDGEPCGVDDPECPEGTICAVVRLEGGDSEPTCVSQDICLEATCPDNAECVLAESFPYQIFCSGTCTGSDCDDPVSS